MIRNHWKKVETSETINTLFGSPGDRDPSPVAEIKSLTSVPDGNCLVSQDLLADPLDVVFRTNFLLFCLSFPGVWERMIRKLSQGLQV